MKKRLRKKLRLREFKELGFTLDFDVDPDDDTAYGLLDARLDELLDSHNLTIVFGYGTLFVKTKPYYKSVTESSRQAIIGWMQKQPEAINLGFGPLADFKLAQRVYLRKPKWKPLPKKWSYH
jgi:uncharacterized protein YggL (DUF469 family)